MDIAHRPMACARSRVPLAPLARRAFSLATLALLLAPIGRAVADDPSPPTPPPIGEEAISDDPYQWVEKKIASFVEQLSSTDHAVREQAHEELVNVGLAAEAHLREGLESEDPEVRRRCRLILSDCLEADYRSRLAQFAAAVEHQKWDELDACNLPVWERYRETFGVSARSTKLFIGLHEAEPGLFATAEADGAALGDAIQMRFQQAYQPYYWPGMSRRTAVPFETIAAILFLSSNPDADLPSSVAGNPYWSSIVGQSSFREALQKGENKPVAKKLLGLWIVGPTSLNTLHQKLQLSIQYDAKEGLDLAFAALENKKTQSAYRGYAAMALGTLGGKEYSRKLAEMLTDETECSRRIRAVNGKRFTDVIQVRDIALAWLIYHTEQEHKDYGWESPISTFAQIKKGNRNSSLSFYNFGFASDEERKKAHDKWNEWIKDNELPPAPDRKFAEIKFIESTNAFNLVKNQGVSDDELARLPGLETADRLYVQALDRAAEAIARGEGVDASAALGEILADPTDFAFQPQRGTPLFRRLKPEAERLLSQLNTEGRAAYQLQFGSEAKRELHDALESGSIDDLRGIGRRYFHTRAGADATYIAAVRLRVQGEPLVAGLLFSRLKSLGWDAERFEPGLSLQLATCLHASGAREEAELLAAQIRDRWGDLSQWKASTEETADAPLSAAAIEYLNEQVLRIVGEATSADWLVYRGNIRRNAEGGSAGAHLEGEPISTGVSTRFEAAEQLTKMIDDLAEAYRTQRQTAIPTMQPLVVGELLIIRTPTALEAYDLATGELKWNAPMEDVLRDIARNMQSKLLGDNDDDKEFLARGLRRRHWDDHAFGRISSDGEHVYSIESHTLGVEGEIQRLIVRADGQRQLDAGALRGHNSLAAHDVATGKLAWEVGGALSQDASEETPDNPLLGLYFLGPPLPVAGDLHAIAMRGTKTLLLTLDPASGSLLHELMLDARPAVVNRYSQLYSPLWMLDRAEHRCGASPAFADGVMICRLSLNRYAAVDPVNRSVLWRFDPEASYEGGGGNAWNNWQKRLLDQANRNPADHWADATPLISDGKVILTPSDLDEMLCLRLRDGHLLWRAPRHDGIYLAGIHDDNVIVVGRGGVRALDVASGQPKFDGRVIDLPPGATPSGIGYFHEDSYFVPLSTAEIVRVDLNQGAVTARSLADGIYPGNTISINEKVITQSPSGVWVFSTLDSRHQQLEKESAEREDDPALMLALGETLLYEGKLREAIDHLRQALELDPNNERATDLLATASLEGLRTDYAAYRNEVQDVLGEAAAPERRFRFLQEQALARQKAGQSVEALQSWLDSVRLGYEPEQMIYTAAARAVRRDRFLAARLEEIYGSASAEEQREMEPLLAEAIEQMPLDQRLDYFAWHASADRQRLALATDLIAGEKDGFLRAEYLLRSVIGPSLSQGESVSPQQAEAVARLSQLLFKTERFDEAARSFAYLNTELAEVVCLEEKTGSDIYNEAAAKTDAASVLSSNNYWPVGDRLTESTKTSSGYRYQYLVPMQFTPNRLAVKSFLEIDTGGTTLTGLNRFGAGDWSVKLPQPSEGWSYSNSIYSHSTGAQFGHLVLAWVGNRVAAVDLLAGGDEPIWMLNTHVAKPPAPGMRRFLPMRLQAQRNFAAPLQNGHAPLALLDDCVCFQQERKLLAVDPLTGKVLWRIDDVAEYSSLYALGDALLVVSNDRDQAVVHSGADGRVVGHRTLPPAASHVGWVAGQLIYWRSTNDGREIVAYDPLADRETFAAVYGENAEATLVDGGELAVLDSDKGLQIWQLPTGNLAMTAECPLPAELQHMIVIPSETSYTLLTSVSGFENSPFASSQAMYGFVEVHGPAHAFERKTGKQLWNTDIENQRMRLHQPVDLPVLVFRNQRYKREGNTSRTSHAHLILDQRTGEEAYKNDNNKSSHFLYQTKVDLEKGTVEVLSSREKVTLYYKEKPKVEKKDEEPPKP